MEPRKRPGYRKDARPDYKRGEASGERSYGEKSYGEKRSGERSYGEKRSGERSYGEKRSGERSFGEKRGGERSYGEKSYGEKRSGERSYGEKSYGEKRSGERSYGEKRGGERSYGEKRSGERSYGEKRYGEKRSGERSYGERSNRLGEREKRYTEKPESVDQTDRDQAEEEINETNPLKIEGRNAVMEALRSGKTIDKLIALEHCEEGSVNTIIREAKKQNIVIQYVSRERLNQISDTGNHQGMIAFAAAYEYTELDDILAKAKEKGEAPFLIFLDGIEDPHNLGAIIRTANLAGAHGVVIPKRRAVGLTAVVAKTSAGALNYTPVAKVTNLSVTMEELKKEGMWFVCADMNGTSMYELNLTGPIGLVIGNEGEGVSRLVREKCDLTAAIPMKGDIDSLNASVATGVLAYEIVRQRLQKVK